MTDLRQLDDLGTGQGRADSGRERCALSMVISLALLRTCAWRTCPANTAPRLRGRAENRVE